MTTYIFHQLGCIPGIPGTFGNCRVDIDDEGTIIETPLPLIAHEPTGEGAPEVEEPAQSAQEETIVPEQTAPTPVPQSIGG